jgi:hypothetical protein
MCKTIPFHLEARTREVFRRSLVMAFLDEAPGNGNETSKYQYTVETTAANKTICLKRPANLNKGFDFEVRVPGESFTHVDKNGRVSHSERPSHKNIFDDLRAKKAEDPAQYQRLRAIIDRVYNCDLIQDNEFAAFSFQSGYPAELIVKCIKWLFVEQDVTYWNGKGRNMLYGGINAI